MTVREITALLKSATTMLAAVAGLITGVIALRGAMVATVKADKAQLAANSAGLDVRQLEKETPAGSPAATGSETYIVQLATYQPTSCGTAQEEIDSYRGEFPTAPTLWRDSSGKYVIVGIKAASLDAAKSIQTKAVGMAKEPAHSSNDLGNARVRINPGWTALASCPPS